jgi:hypothetical protein
MRYRSMYLIQDAGYVENGIALDVEQDKNRFFRLDQIGICKLRRAYTPRFCKGILIYPATLRMPHVEYRNGDLYVS